MLQRGQSAMSLSPLLRTTTDSLNMDTRHDHREKEIFEYGCKMLGRVVYHFQSLESELGRAVSFLINPDEGEAADVVVCELSFKQLAHLGYSLFDLYDMPAKEVHLSEWKRILGLCLNAENRRNQLLHSNYYACYSGGPGNMEFMRYKRTAKFNRGSRFVDEEMNQKAVEEFMKEIGGVEVQIIECMGKAFPGWCERRWESPRI